MAMNNAEIALKYLNNDYLINASIIEPIKAGSVEILYAGSDCVMVRDKVSGVYMLQTENFTLADELLNTLPQDAVLVAHNTKLAELSIAKLSFTTSTPCYQGVYRKGILEVEHGELNIRLMRIDEAAVASEMYGFTVESAIKHINMGLIYGAYLGDETVGMIGMHYQGSMGLLEVKEKYRRRGYAEIMEKLLINDLLKKGMVPYCQIIEGNEPSLALQRKIGLDISPNLLYWLHKDPDEACSSTQK